MLKLDMIISNFFERVQIDRIEIYNEFSLQHELGIYLRMALPTYKVQFERNVSFFTLAKQTIKKEIDISIFSEDMNEKYAIELKCPLNGQYSEQMYSFVKDIKFMEQLKESGFNKTAAVTLVSDRPFYEGKQNIGIYNYFRGEKLVCGDIYKPTGQNKNDEFITILGEYDIDWIELNEERKFYIVEI